jgi:hypothetical protein
MVVCLEQSTKYQLNQIWLHKKFLGYRIKFNLSEAAR